MKIDSIPGKCPHCMGAGCSKCEDGVATFTFAKGGMFTQACRACGKGNGCRITEEDIDGDQVTHQACCWCGSPEVYWSKVGDSE